MADKDDPALDRQDLLDMVDGLIMSMVTVRRILTASLPEQVYTTGEPVQPDVLPKPDPHAGHNVKLIGFGEPPYCLDCEEYVGASPPGE